MLTGHVLKLSCPDQPGLVYRVTRFLFENSANIADSAQFNDKRSGRFFMRIQFDGIRSDELASLSDHFQHEVARRHAMDFEFHDLSKRCRALLLVSQHGHCLNDLLFRWYSNHLPIEPVGIVSNHPTFEKLALSHEIPFHHIPVTPENKREAESNLMALVESTGAELVVLARYMQILSPELCAQLRGRAINIHHSFLPSFKGARPYNQAFERGVKLIGATAHYVTENLDEGPIIEQDIARVDHRMEAESLATAGKDIESRVLARAVSWHAEHRVILNGNKTIVFS